MNIFRKKAKTGAAILSAAALLAGIFAGVPRGVTVANAADTADTAGTGSAVVTAAGSAENGRAVQSSAKLSATAFATVDNLMNDFTPNADGTADNVAKLIFGKDSDGNALEWYVLGKDSGVSGDNTAIFAASPIISAEKYEDNASDNKTYEEAFGQYAANPAEVHPNHYGASDVRAKLNSIAGDTKYFVYGEQRVLNKTTVSSYDADSKVNYTTSNKLYLPDGTDGNNGQLLAGSGNDKVLSMNTYSGSGNAFWLRSPDNTASGNALYSNTSGDIQGKSVSEEAGVRPAANLDLSEVKFASAAVVERGKDTSGIITPGSVMTPRYKANNSDDIGWVTYNNTGSICAERNSFMISLVVQGNDGTNDWYYTKNVYNKEIVTASEIKEALNLSSDIDLDKCKIWIETTLTDDFTLSNGIGYASDFAQKITEEEITGYISVRNIDQPIPEKQFDRTGNVEYKISNKVGLKSIKWYERDDINLGKEVAEDETADYGTWYYIVIELAAQYGYIFSNDTYPSQVSTSVSASPMRADVSDDQKTLVVCKVLKTADDRLISIEPPQPIQVEAGTAYEDMNLPEKVNITTKFNTRTTASVEWNTEYIKSGSYDPSILTEQTVTLRGRVTDVYSINVDNVWEYLELTINIKAADAAEAPTADITPGTYTENQSVILTSATEDAVIYYTTDGSEPALADGVPSGTTKQYTAPIAVKGEAGQSVETTIKAFAVKSGMNNSAVETFTYTIDIPAPVKKYTLTVVDGLGSGEYEENEQVTITADEFLYGMPFWAWTGLEGVTIVSGSEIDLSVTFLMPAKDITVYAHYDYPYIPTVYTIEASVSGAGGSISPSDTTYVEAGCDKTFVITPDEGFEIDKLLVDGKQVDASLEYTFRYVDDNHSIEVTFKKKGGQESTTNQEPTTKQEPATKQEPTTNQESTTNPASTQLRYKILDGADSKWSEDTNGNLMIRGNGEFSKFTCVKVDGSIIDASNYTAREGSTIITLKAEYLDTLAEGSHSFELVWTDGSAYTTFTVAKNEDSDDNDDSNDDNDADGADNGSNTGNGNVTGNVNNGAGAGNINNGTGTADGSMDAGISETKAAEENAAASADTSPKTGDASHTEFWIMLMAAALAGITELVMLAKRKGKEE